MSLLPAEHEVGCVPPKFENDDLRRGKNPTNKFEKKPESWKLLQTLEILSTTCAMMVNTVALFALHV